MKEEGMLGLSPGLRDNPFPGLLLNQSGVKENPFPGLLPGFARGLPGLPPVTANGLSLPLPGTGNPGQSNPAIPNMWPFIFSHISNLLPQLSISRMDPVTQMFSLRWTQHTSNMFSVFERLLASEAFTDVTLACDGGSIKCHQIVLAASSDYFQKLFLDNNTEHPIVFLKDVKADQVRAILDYMYKGEVNVSQEDLPALLRVAEMLKIKGMTEETAKNGERKESVLPHPRSLSPTSGGPPNSIVPPPNGDSLIPPSARTPTSLPLPPGAIPPNFRPFLTPPGGSSTSPFPMWPGLPGLFPGAHNLFNRHEDRKDLSPGPRDRSKMSSGSSSDKEIPIPPLIPRDSSEDRSDKGSFKDDNDDKAGGMKVDGSIAGYVPAQRLEWKRYKQYTRNDIMAAIEEVRKGKSALQVSKKFNIPSRTLYDKVKKMGITTGRQQQRKQMNNTGSSSSFNYSAAFPSLNMMTGGPLGHLGPDNIAIPDNPYKSIMERMKDNRTDDRDDSRDSIAENEVKSGSLADTMRKDLGPMPFSILPPHMLNMMERIKAEDKEREMKEADRESRERENTSPMNLSSERDRDNDKRTSEGSFPHSPSPGSTELTTSPSNCQTSPTERSFNGGRDTAGSPEHANGQHIDIRARFLADLRRFGDTRASLTSPEHEHTSPRSSQDSLPPRKRKLSHESSHDPRDNESASTGKLNLPSDRQPGFNGLCETDNSAAIVN